MRTAFFIFLICSLIALNVAGGNNTMALLISLDEEIEKRDAYLEEKQQRIDVLTKQLNYFQQLNNGKDAYETCLDLFLEYQSYSYDSAFVYVMELFSIANSNQDSEQLAQAKTKLGFTLLSSGLFKEAIDTMESIDVLALDNELKADYHYLLGRAYFDLHDYHSDSYYSPIYSKKGIENIKSALKLLSDDTAQYWLLIGILNAQSGKHQEAAEAFNFLISQFTISQHEFAIATSALGWLYNTLGRTEDAIDMLAKAAIADIKSSTKETVALRNLAVHLFEQGDVQRAYRYIRIALEDATVYNARHRKVQIGAVLPIIEGERLSTVEKQRKQLLNYSLVVSMLSVLVISFFSIIFLQFRRLNRVKLVLQETNNSLREINQSLREANKIKQEYIGYFFSVNSEYIDKIESFQKSLHRKVITKQFSDIENILTKTDLKKERQNLYINFDKIFLKIFPNFIEEFNKLFDEKDWIYPGKEELLNTDLRIFALIRLGITDNEKISKFLNYSVNTIYTYKTKIKNKTIVNRDDFEKRLMEIKSF